MTRFHDMNRQYENLRNKPSELGDLKIQLEEAQGIILAYQNHLAILLTKDWYIERLPEIRKHVQENIIRNNNQS